jgi:hypothetical protein
VTRPPPRGVRLAGDPNVPDLGTQAKVDLAATASPWTTGTLRPGRFLRWETQRGCPFHCSFCQHRAPGGFGVQQVLGERLRAEIELFCRDDDDDDDDDSDGDNAFRTGSGSSATRDGILAARSIAVLDPTFNASEAHAVAVLDAFREGGFRGRLSLQVRPEKLTRRFLDAAAAVGPGQVTLEFGVQTAVPAELDLIDRIVGADAERIVAQTARKLKMVAEYGSDLSSEISLIFALPGQTVGSFQTSIEWCRQVLPSAKLVAFPLMLLRGTALQHRAAELGLVEGLVTHPGIDRIQDFIPHVTETPHMSAKQWVTMADMAAALPHE